MSDEEESLSIDEAATKLKQRAEAEVANANQHHQQLDTMKSASAQTASEILGQAQLLYELGEIDDGDLEALQAQAQRIHTVSERVTG